MRMFLLSLTLLACTPLSVLAELSVPHFFSDHMVLQREREANVWGHADPGAAVVVKFKGSTTKVVANDDGTWRAAISTGKADASGAPLRITSGSETLTIKDVLVGEVWFASGQSNMVFTMNRVPAYTDVIAESNCPLIRMFNAPNVTAVDPQDDISGEWTLCSPDTVPGYSAVAFFFARKLHDELGVPIGVIKSAWGGKPVETFTSREALRTLPGTRALVERTVAADEKFDLEKATAAYEVKMEQWKNNVAKWRKKSEDERGRAPRRPAAPKRALLTEGQPGVLFNSMINPFVGYTIQGSIWYQGEGNAKPGAVPYDQTLPLLITDWRTRWQDDFSFYFVQLANFRAPSTEPGNNDSWPLLQDRMRLILDTTPKTGMAIINDIGEADDIHPKNKHDVGERLALWALAKDYGRDIVYSGPLYKSFSVKKGSVVVKFDQVGDGLKSRDGGKLERFEIAGEDRIWHWADAEIVGKDSVRVSSDQVQNPVAVRYAWAANPSGANLINSERLPASVFRTDDWSDVEIVVDNTAQSQIEERRALAAEIKELVAKKASLERNSEEYKEVSQKQRELLEKFRALPNPVAKK